MAISIHVMPSDQISALWSYPDCLMTSGDIQYGVPTNVFCTSVGYPLPEGQVRYLQVGTGRLVRCCACQIVLACGS